MICDQISLQVRLVEHDLSPLEFKEDEALLGTLEDDLEFEALGVEFLTFPPVKYGKFYDERIDLDRNCGHWIRALPFGADVTLYRHSETNAGTLIEGRPRSPSLCCRVSLPDYIS